MIADFGNAKPYLAYQVLHIFFKKTDNLLADLISRGKKSSCFIKPLPMT